jgi:hypothetical protein
MNNSTNRRLKRRQLAPERKMLLCFMPCCIFLLSRSTVTNKSFEEVMNDSKEWGAKQAWTLIHNPVLPTKENIDLGGARDAFHWKRNHSERTVPLSSSKRNNESLKLIADGVVSFSTLHAVTKSINEPTITDAKKEPSSEATMLTTTSPPFVDYNYNGPGGDLIESSSFPSDLNPFYSIVPLIPLQTRLFAKRFDKFHSLPLNEALQIYYQGILGSNHMHLAGLQLVNATKGMGFEQDWKDDDVWVIDMDSLLGACHVLEPLVAQTSAKVLIMDYGDNHERLATCPSFGSLRHVKRSIVDGRVCSRSSGSCEPGSIGVYPNHTVVHGNYAVRLDVYNAIQSVLLSQSHESVFDTVRPMDVSHFWQIHHYYSYLRNTVNYVLANRTEGTALAQHGNKNSAVRTFCGILGQFMKIGRNLASIEYAHALLSTKITVVAQRDNWEDHYRLMEATVSGSMIICDPMVTLPKGLKDGESVVFFHSSEDLHSKILYYLLHDEERERIARRAHAVSVGRHMPWHRMEDFVFGRPLTNVTIDASIAGS